MIIKVKLIYFILLILFFVKVIAITFLPVTFEYDEEIITQISKQPFYDLFQTLYAEPHPPGIYLLLKGVGVFGDYATKIFFVSISTALMFFALWYMARSKLIEHFRLGMGLLIFLSSAGYFASSVTLKQDAISLPLFFLFVSTCFAIITKDTKRARVSLLLLQIALLFFSYLYFAASILILFALWGFYKKTGFIRVVVFNLLIFFVYFISFGAEQLYLNSSRFTWIEYAQNSFVRAFGLQFFQSRNFGMLTLVALIFSAILLYFLSVQKNIRSYEKYSLYCVPIIFIIGYLGKLFVTARYASVLFLFYSIILGWSISYFKINRAYILTVVGAIFLIPGLVFGLLHSIVVQNQTHSLIASINSFAAGPSYIGFIVDHPIYPYVFAHRLNRTIVPYSLFTDLRSGRRQLDKEILSKDGEYTLLTTRQLESKFSETHLTQFVYFSAGDSLGRYYDPQKTTYSTLSHHCRLEKEIVLNPSQKLYYFNQCGSFL
ncbi:MAG: hypothetical protein M3Q44_01115 [bacterium]|nr:hypothetical protein [bacterium]